MLQVAPGSAQPAQQPALPRPVLAREEFQQLCLEGSCPATGSRVQQPTFIPLAEDEAPRAGLLLGLDAEFVALSQPDRRIIGRGIISLCMLLVMPNSTESIVCRSCARRGGA